MQWSAQEYPYPEAHAAALAFLRQDVGDLLVTRLMAQNRGMNINKMSELVAAVVMDAIDMGRYMADYERDMAQKGLPSEDEISSGEYTKRAEQLRQQTETVIALATRERISEPEADKFCGENKFAFSQYALQHDLKAKKRAAEQEEIERQHGAGSTQNLDRGLVGGMSSAEIRQLGEILSEGLTKIARGVENIATVLEKEVQQQRGTGGPSGPGS